jgi:hypothetical protein
MRYRQLQRKEGQGQMLGVKCSYHLINTYPDASSPAAQKAGSEADARGQMLIPPFLHMLSGCIIAGCKERRVRGRCSGSNAHTTFSTHVRMRHRQLHTKQGHAIPTSSDGFNSIAQPKRTRSQNVFQNAVSTFHCHLRSSGVRLVARADKL